MLYDCVFGVGYGRVWDVVYICILVGSVFVYVFMRRMVGWFWFGCLFGVGLSCFYGCSLVGGIVNIRPRIGVG